MNVVSAFLASTFGHGSRRPIRAAWVKLGVLWVGSLAIGFLVPRSLPDLAKSSNFSQATWLIAMILAAQITILLSLTVSASILSSSKINLILALLPLKKSQSTFLMLLPSLILVLCSLTLVIPSLAVISHSIGLPPLLFIAGMSVGSLSAFGMTYAHMSRGLCIALAGLSIAGEYKLLSLFRSTHGWIAALVIFSIVGIFCMLAIRSGRTFQNLIRRPAPAQYVKTRSLPRWTWFAKKFWRYTPLRRSFLVTILLGAGLAAIVVKYGALSSSFIALPAQLLAAALTSDIRALARPRLPPEIGALKGTLYFVRQSITIGVVVAIIALLPIEIAAIIFDLSITALLAGIISGVAFGLFVGAWLIPCPSDISTQLTANLACLCIAVGTSQINNFSQRYLYILQCSLALLAIGLTFHFEYKRNALTWRKHDI